MAEHDCGGCRGEGAHRRWCSNAVGLSASLFGSLAEQVESVGDRIGPNDMGLANRAWSLSAGLRTRAIEEREKYLDRMGRHEDTTEGLGT